MTSDMRRDVSASDAVIFIVVVVVVVSPPAAISSRRRIYNPIRLGTSRCLPVYLLVDRRMSMRLDVLPTDRQTDVLTVVVVEFAVVRS